MNRHQDWSKRAQSAAEVVDHLKSGDKVFVHGAAATPSTLLDAMIHCHGREQIELYHLHLSGECRFTDRDYAGMFTSYSLFTGPSLRAPIREGRADYVPVFLSDIPGLFSSRRI